MKTISWVPGAVVAGNNINLPANAPDIDAVVVAEIVRLPSSLDDHTLDTQVAVGGAVTNALGHDATPALETAAGANVSIAGCISAHAGADPIVAAVPTKVDGDTITLDVNTELGDVLYLTYMEEGARVLVS